MRKSLFVVLSLVLAMFVATPANAQPYILASGGTLTAGQSMTSANGRYQLSMQGDGNLVLFRKVDMFPVWATYVMGAGNWAVMQPDGNFVVYNSSNAWVWNTSTYGTANQNSYLYVQDDGNLVVYRPDGVPLWASNTGQPKITDVQIPDANFRNCILSAANAATPKWVFADQVVTLACQNKGIRSISGVQAFQMLQTFYIGQNLVSDLTPLNSLTRLRTLGTAAAIPDSNPLYTASISAIKGISSIQNLTVFSASGANRLQVSAFSDGFAGLRVLRIYTLEMGGTPAPSNAFPCSFIVYLSNRIQTTGMTLYFNSATSPSTNTAGSAPWPVCVAGT